MPRADGFYLLNRIYPAWENLNTRMGGRSKTMADEKTSAEVIEQTDEPTAEPHGTTESIDWKKESRKHEDREKKYKAEADSLREKAAKWDELEEQNKSELDKLTEQLDAVTKERDELAHAQQQRAWREEVAAETKVPASILRGNTKEEIAAHAKEILDSGLSAYGKVDDKGEASVSTVTRESIEKIPNQLDRVRARAEHANLYK